MPKRRAWPRLAIVAYGFRPSSRSDRRLSPRVRTPRAQPTRPHACRYLALLARSRGRSNVRGLRARRSSALNIVHQRTSSAHSWTIFATKSRRAVAVCANGCGERSTAGETQPGAAHQNAVVGCRGEGLRRSLLRFTDAYLASWAPRSHGWWAETCSARPGKADTRQRFNPACRWSNGVEFHPNLGQRLAPARRKLADQSAALFAA